MRFLLSFLCALSAPTFLLAVASPWLGAEQIGDKAYFLHAAAPRIEVFDLNESQWLDAIELAKAPTCFESDEKYLYIAYGKTLYRYGHDLSAETHVANFANNVVSLHADGEILIANASYQGVLLESFNRETRAKIDSLSSTNTYNGSFSQGKAQLQPEANRLVSADSYSNLFYLTYNDEGDLAGSITQKYYNALGDRLFVWPNSPRLISSQGIVFTSIDLTPLAQLPQPRAVAYVEETLPIIASSDRITAFSRGLHATGAVDVDFETIDLFTQAETAIAFYVDPDSANGMGFLALSFDELEVDDPSLPIDPATHSFEPDDAFVDQSGVLHLADRAFELIFRWDTATQSWLDSIVLQATPSDIEYDAARDVIYLGYPFGEITTIDPAAEAPVETVFIDTSDHIALIVAVGDHLFIDRHDGSSRTFYTYDLDGQVIDSEVHGSSNNDAVWNASSRRIVYIDKSASFGLHSGQINLDGTLADSSNTSVVPYTINAPLHSHPSETLVLTASGALVNPETRVTAATLPYPVIDATWIDGDLFSLHQGKLQTWTLPTYEESDAYELPTDGLNLLATPDDKLALVAALDSGRLRITLLDTDLNRVPPISLQAPELALGQQRLSAHLLEWTPSASADVYEIERSLDGVTDWTKIGEVGFQKESFSAMAEPGQDFHYRVRAVSGEVQSEYSNSVTASSDLEFATLVPRLPQFNYYYSQQPKAVFVDHRDILYLAYPEQSYLFRYDLTDQTWMDAIELQAPLTAVHYDSDSKIVYLGYATGKSTQISLLLDLPTREYDFASIVPEQIYSFAVSDQYAVLMAYYDHHLFDTSGTLLATNSSGYNYSNRATHWNEAGNAYIWNYYGNLAETTIGDDYSFTNTSTTNDSSDALIAVDTSGSLLLTSSGKLYSDQLGASLNHLGTHVTDGIWIDTQLYTIYNQKLVAWTLPTYSEGDSLTYPNATLLGLGKTAGGNLVIVHGQNGLAPRVDIRDSAFALVAPDTLAVPGTLSLTNPTAGSVSLSWFDVGGETGYAIERKADDGAWTVLDTTSADITSFTDSSVDPGTDYDYRVKAVNGPQEGSYTQVLAISSEPPTAATNLQASLEDGSRVQLTWELGERAHILRVQRRSDYYSWSNIAELAPTATEFEDSNLSDNQLYRYRIVSVGAFGATAESNTVEVAYNLAVPSKPIYLQSSAYGIDRISLAWGASSRVSTYRIERALDSDPAEWTVVAEIDGALSSHLDSGLDHSTSYRYRITAINPTGESSPASFPGVKTAVLPAPSKPRLYAGQIDDSSVLLTWLKAGTAETYNVLRKTVDATEWTVLAERDAESASYTDADLALDDAYIYAVVGINEIGESPLSNQALVIISERGEVFSDHFDTLNQDLYYSISGQLAEDPTPGIGKHLMLNGYGYTTIQTKAVSIPQGAVVEFDIRFEGSSEAARNRELGLRVASESGWNEPLRATAYQIAADGQWTRVAVTLPRVAWSNATTLVFTLPAYGEESWHIDNLTVHALSVKAPQPPYTVAAKGASDGGASVFWSHSVNADSYVVEQSQDGGESWTVVYTGNSGSHYYHDPSPYNEESLYRVSAENVGGRSEPTRSDAVATNIELADAVQSGVDKVLANPIAHGLYTLADLDEARVAGHQEVQNSPSHFGLFQQETLSHLYFKLGAEAIDVKGDLLTVAWVLYRSSDLINWTEHPFQIDTEIEEGSEAQFIKVAPDPEAN